jgi:hypothetical protein
MSGALKNRGSEGGARINIQKDHELEYWARELGVTEEHLTRLVIRYDTSVAKIRHHLGQAAM